MSPPAGGRIEWSIITPTLSPSRTIWTLGLLTATIGAAAAIHFGWLDLTLSHYDARGHLVVARRVFDNLTPGWMQLGAVWLPLPHVLNAVPAQLDWAYQTGAFGVVLSIAFMASGLAAIGGFLVRYTGSSAVGVCLPLAVLLNPNVLYLQSTPMTEPMLFGLACLALVGVDAWLTDGAKRHTRLAGCALAALVLTRYEGWCIAGALGGLAIFARPKDAPRLLLYPGLAILAFLLLSYGSTGRWFVTGGFFEATNPALGDPWRAWTQILEGTERLSDPWIVRIGLAGGLGVLATAWWARRDGRAQVARALLPLSLAAAAALPLYAFTSGHPVRIRYMVSVVVALLILSAGLLRWLPRRMQSTAAVGMLALALWSAHPLDPDAPMVREAQWERPYSDARRAVTAALAARWDGTPVLASMGSLAHYMQQMSRDGFSLRDFVHEGNGELWHRAQATPAVYVRWILIEESAEGGDVLAHRARESDEFLSGFTRVMDGGGVALYHRQSGNLEGR